MIKNETRDCWKPTSQPILGRANALFNCDIVLVLTYSCRSHKIQKHFDLHMTRRNRSTLYSNRGFISSPQRTGRQGNLLVFSHLSYIMQNNHYYLPFFGTFRMMHRACPMKTPTSRTPILTFIFRFFFASFDNLLRTRAFHRSIVSLRSLSRHSVQCANKLSSDYEYTMHSCVVVKLFFYIYPTLSRVILSISGY